MGSNIERLTVDGKFAIFYDPLAFKRNIVDIVRGRDNDFDNDTFTDHNTLEEAIRELFKRRQTDEKIIKLLEEQESYVRATLREVYFYE